MKHTKLTILITTYQTPPHLNFACPQAKLNITDEDANIKQ